MVMSRRTSVVVGYASMRAPTPLMLPCSSMPPSAPCSSTDALATCTATRVLTLYGVCCTVPEDSASCVCMCV